MLLISLSLAFIFIMIASGYFTGAGLTSWLLFGVLPATIFLLVVLLINFWPEIQQVLQQKFEKEDQIRKEQKALFLSLKK